MGKLVKKVIKTATKVIGSVTGGLAGGVPKAQAAPEITGQTEAAQTPTIDAGRQLAEAELQAGRRKGFMANMMTASGDSAVDLAGEDDQPTGAMKKLLGA